MAKITPQDKKEDILKAYKDSEKEKSTMMSQMELMMQQMNEMKEQMENQSKATVVKLEQPSTKVKSIKMMSLSIGQCYLVDGILNARFEKAFDQVPLRETVFQDFYYRFKPWFDDLEIIILDDDIAEEYGMKPIYDKHGISETFMANLIKMDSGAMIEHLSTMIPKLQMVFVKYFAGEVANENPDALNSTKHYALQEFVMTKFGFEVDIKKISEEIK